MKYYAILFALIFAVSSFAADKTDKKTEKKLLDQDDSAFTQENYQKMSAELSKDLVSLQEKLKNDPKSAKLHYEFAQKLLLAGKFEDSFTEMTQSIDLIPESTEKTQSIDSFSKEDKEKYTEALIYSMKRMDQEALESIAALMEKYPKNPDLIYQYAIIKGNAGDYPEFFEYVYKAASLQKDTIDYHRVLGGMYVILGNNKKAEEHFAKCLEKNYSYAPAFLWLGKLRFIEKNFEEGIYLLKKAHELEPENYSILITLGRIYSEMGQHDTAEKLLKQAIEINGSHWEAFETLGFLYYQKNDVEKSIEMFKNVIVLNPNQVEPLLNLAKVYQLKGRYDEAISVYKSAIKLEPNAFILYCDLADLYVANTDYKLAAENFQKALDIYDESPLAHYRLALVLRKLKEYQQSAAHLKKAIKLKTDFTDAYEALYYLYKDDIRNDAEAEYYLMMHKLIAG